MTESLGLMPSKEAFLAEYSGRLASSLDRMRTLETIVHAAVPFAARAAAVLDGTKVMALACASKDEEEALRQTLQDLPDVVRIPLGPHTLSFVSPPDVSLLPEIVERASAALDNASLYSSEHGARVSIETFALRLSTLQTLTNALSRAVTRDEITDIIIDSAHVALGAARITLWRRKEDVLELVRASNKVVSKELARVPRADRSPLWEAIERREPIYVASHAEFVARFPLIAERSSPPQPHSFVCLPLLGAGDGVLALGFDMERTFSSEERSFYEIFGQACADAIHRASLYESERKARRSAEVLYDLAVSMARSDDLEEIYAIGVAGISDAINIERSAVLLFEDDDVMRFKASRGISREYRQAVEGHSPWRRTDKDAEPLAMSDVVESDDLRSYAEIFKAERIRALAFIPIIHNRRLLGKFMLYSNDPREFTESELQIAMTVGNHLGQAVERIRAEAEIAQHLEAETRARTQAEEALRAREDILAVVSHDLRNPLGAVLLTAANLLRAKPDPVRTRAYVERVQRNAQRMARLIDDLVDYGAIEAGKLTVDLATCSAPEIVFRALETFTPIAEERRVRLESASVDIALVTRCDRERAVQALANLLSNALKVTPPGGTVIVDAQADGTNVVFSVKDTGPGIDAEELPRLFERYWRGKQPGYKGAGLGLAIAKGLIEAQGGRIWVESMRGVGATFLFTLPLVS